jgi:hypothetical protein
VDESSREKLISQLLVASELGQRVSRVRRRSSAQINGDADSDSIHDLHGAGQVFGRAINVLMKIDDAMFPSPAVGRLVYGDNSVGRVQPLLNHRRANAESYNSDQNVA